MQDRDGRVSLGHGLWAADEAAPAESGGWRVERADVQACQRANGFLNQEKGTCETPLATCLLRLE